MNNKFQIVSNKNDNYHKWIQQSNKIIVNLWYNRNTRNWTSNFRTLVESSAELFEIVELIRSLPEPEPKMSELEYWKLRSEYAEKLINLVIFERNLEDLTDSEIEYKNKWLSFKDKSYEI